MMGESSKVEKFEGDSNGIVGEVLTLTPFFPILEG